MKTCAYCGSGGPLTNEHIFPAWLCARRDEKVSFSAAFPGRGVRGDLQIGDVCATCNGGRLASLDGYAKTVFDPFLQTPKAGARIFRCDRNRLFRWALKVTYNAERAARDEFVELLRPAAPFILGDEPEPPFLADVLVALVPGVRSTPDERDAGAGPTLEVLGDKIGQQTCFGPDVASAPCISVGPILLQMMIWRAGTPRGARRRPINWARRGMRFERMRPGKNEIRLRPSQMTARTWIKEVTMDQPGVTVEGEERSGVST